MDPVLGWDKLTSEQPALAALRIVVVLAVVFTVSPKPASTQPIST
ncbi:hypothetical protein [Mycobacterium lepromatosis]